MTEYLDLVFCDCWNFEKRKRFCLLCCLETESSPLELMIVFIKEVPVSCITVSCITVGYFCYSGAVSLADISNSGPRLLSSAGRSISWCRHGNKTNVCVYRSLFQYYPGC